MSLSQGLNFDLVKPGVKPTYIIYANKINYPSLILEETIQLSTASAIPFYGHVRRHDSLQGVILEGKVEGGKERAGRTTSRLICINPRPARGWRCLSGRGGGGGGGRGGDKERGDALRSGSLVPADNNAASNERRNSNSSEGYGGGVILRPDKPVGGGKERRPD